MSIKVNPENIDWNKYEEKEERKIIPFKDVYDSLPSVKECPLAIPLGVNEEGEALYTDIESAPHILIAGTSGSGKTVYLNGLITSLISRVSPSDLKFVLIDIKRVEMNRYKEIPHLYYPLINDAENAKRTLDKLVNLMNERYKAFENANYSTNIKEYNAWAIKHNKETIPYIIVVIDEYADLYYSNEEVGGPLLSLLMKARASGIHIIISTQRPAPDIITGDMKHNMPTKICFATASVVDSISAIDEEGAEELKGSGDMLVKLLNISRNTILHLQAAYISGSEIKEVTEELKKRYQVIDKEYKDIKSWAKSQEYISISKIQRECSIGFNRASKMLTRLQEEGIVSKESNKRGFKVIQ